MKKYRPFRSFEQIKWLPELVKTYRRGNGDLGGGGNNVGLVHPSEGDTVDLVGASDEEETGIKLLEEDNTLATESASEEDENGAGGYGRSEGGSGSDLF